MNSSPGRDEGNPMPPDKATGAKCPLPDSLTNGVVTLSPSDYSSHPSDVSEDVDRTLRAPSNAAVEERSISPSFPDEATETLTAEQEIAPLFPTAKQSKFSKWLWLTFVASLGLHIGILLIPTGNEPQPAAPKKPEQQIRITQLPTLKKVPTVNKSKPVVKRSPQAVNRPKSTTPPVPPVEPVKPKATEKVDEPAGDNPWQDFPLYPGSEAGCFGLSSCLQASGSLGEVSAHFAKELPAKKYTAKRTIQEPGREIYQVSRNGMTQFLSILQGDKGAVYVLSDAPRTLEDLKKAVEVPPEVQNILVGLGVEQADPSQFAQPDLFYTRSDAKGLGLNAQVQRPEIRNISLVSGQTAETMMDEYFRTNLQTTDYEVNDLPQQYGGGNVYQVKKENIVLYINLVPTKDATGTLIVIWKDLPK